MTVTNWTKKKLTKIIIYFYILLILFLLLTVSSYTWFSRSKLNRVSNMSVYVNTPVGLQIAARPDSEEWGQQLSYVDLVNESSPLRPVTYSEDSDQFFAAVYDIDGRLTGEWIPLTDECHANRNNYEGYYSVVTIYARTDEHAEVALAPAVALDGGKDASGTYLIGVPKWDSDKIAHTNAGEGAENAVRIGIKITRLDGNDEPTGELPLFYIYEPNCDTHLDGSIGYVDTPSIDGDATLVSEDMIIKQSASSWTEADPVQKNVQLHTFGEFQKDPKLFTLEAGEKVMIQFYIWLEGQDADCTNAIKEAQIMANIQFISDTRHQSGLQPIE